MLIRIGTRQSPLALWQAEYVSSLLKHRGHSVELVRITTSGDVSTTPLGQSGGVGLFTKEIQRALLDGRCDLAVHSLKDLPTEVIPELHLAAVPPREDTADCLLATTPVTVATLPENAKIGTGSPRRRAQLLHLRPDLVVLDIRGNVDTRIRKLDAGDYDAILLAYAGLHRLGLSERITEKISHDQVLPAVGQAALGLETRSDDEATITALETIDDLATHLAVRAERNVLRQMRAGCLAPLAAHARFQDGALSIEVRVFSPDGQQRIECSVNDAWPDSSTSPTREWAESVGLKAANELYRLGAGELIHASSAKVD